MSKHIIIKPKHFGCSERPVGIAESNCITAA
nr:MAG TPA: hypothetical protein [Crassvirales sp.]